MSKKTVAISLFLAAGALSLIAIGGVGIPLILIFANPYTLVGLTAIMAWVAIGVAGLAAAVGMVALGYLAIKGVVSIVASLIKTAKKEIDTAVFISRGDEFERIDRAATLLKRGMKNVEEMTKEREDPKMEDPKVLAQTFPDSSSCITAQMQKEEASPCEKNKENVLGEEPETLEELMTKAKTAEGLKKYDDAIASYEKVLEQDPNHEAAREAAFKLNLKVAEKLVRNANKAEEVIKHCDAAIKIDSKHPRPYMLKGIALAHQEKYTLAKASFECAKNRYQEKDENVAVKHCEETIERLQKKEEGNTVQLFPTM